MGVFVYYQAVSWAEVVQYGLISQYVYS